MTSDVANSTAELISPYAGRLIDLRLDAADAAERRRELAELPSIVLSDRSVCDLELLAVGAFSPLDQFMGEQDYQRVLQEMRLASGTLYPIPITLPVDDPPSVGDRVALQSAGRETLAEMAVEQVYQWDLEECAQATLGTSDSRHPLVAEMHRWGGWNISGPLQVHRLPSHFDFEDLRLTPADTRRRLEQMGRSAVVAFQTRNPLHRVHEELTKRAIAEHDATLLLHPVVGLTKPGDISHYTRVRTYRALAARYYERSRILLAVLQLAMRFAGPREALWHAIIRRNYGANFMIVGREHASPGLDSKGNPFYAPYAAQSMLESHAEEIGVRPVPFQELVYVPDEQRYEERSKLAPGTAVGSLSGRELREDYLDKGLPPPDWFARPEVAEILTDSYVPRHKQGLCVWFTGLSGAGKSTTAEVLAVMLQEHGRKVTLLDGDIVRTHLSKGLGFSKMDRDTNIRRIGFVAAEIVRHGGTVICAAVSPYRATRNDVRRMVGADQFVEVFVDTPLEVCEARDRKGLYKRARRGEITGFTGIDDPYEQPEHPEIVIRTVDVTPQDNSREIVEFLTNMGLLRGSPLAA